MLQPDSAFFFASNQANIQGPSASLQSAKTVPYSLSVEFVSQGRCASACAFFIYIFFFANNQANIQRPKRKRAETVPFGYSVEFVSQGRCDFVERYKKRGASVHRRSPLVSLLSL